eukprot:scaffold375_cov175-Skeletonema_dohrnii-CCMP3373.AAC.5
MAFQHACALKDFGAYHQGAVPKDSAVMLYVLLVICETVMKDGKNLLGREAQLGLMPLNTSQNAGCSKCRASAYSDGVSWPTSPLSLQSVSLRDDDARKGY